MNATMPDVEEYTYEKQKARSNYLAAGLRRMADIVSSLPELQLRVADLRDEAKSVEEGRFTIVVLGAFNRGKSTLLNAMIGREILPMAAVPSTAIITLLRYSPTEQIILHFKDKTTAGPFTADEFREKYVLPVVEQIEAQTATEVDEDADEAELERRQLRAARDMFSNIDYAEVGFPCELCQNGVEFVDSPGFEDDDARTERAKTFLDKSHAVLFLLDATHPVTDHDNKTLEWVASRGKRAIFFAINKWNFLEIMERTPAGRAKVEQRFRTKLAKYTAEGGADMYDARVFKINALGAFDARTISPADPAMLDKSNVPALERTLERFLVEERVEARDNALISKAGNFCYDLDRVIERMLRLRQKNLGNLMETREKLAPKLEQLRGVRRHIEAFLDGQTVTVQKRLAESLNTHMANLDANKLVQEMDLSVIEGAWMSYHGLKDGFVKAVRWATGYMKNIDLFTDKVRQALEPQLEAAIKEEFKSWQAGEAAFEMKAEAKKMIDYLREEAADFQRILIEIAQILGEQNNEKVDVEKLIKEWLATTVAKGGIQTVSIGAAGFAIDLAPMVAAIAAEIALHIKGALIPVVGTIAAFLWAIWRQAKTVEAIKQGIVDKLRTSLINVPNSEQRSRIDADVEKNFSALKDTVLVNINIKINSIQLELDSAIADVEKGNIDVRAERDRLGGLQEEIRQEFTALKDNCTVA